jgi:hypothetical protein
VHGPIRITKPGLDHDHSISTEKGSTWGRDHTGETDDAKPAPRTNRMFLCLMARFGICQQPVEDAEKQ